MIELHQVTKEYTNGKDVLRVLSHVDLSIPTGKAVVITGESGSGKSTLLHLLGAMDRPTSGTIRVGSWEVSKEPETKLNQFRLKALGFVFQFHHLLKDFTALENVMMPGLMAGLPRAQAQAQALKLLDRVGVASRKDAYPTELSGGERQRTAVARAVMNDPEVILADEPTGSLDEYHSREVEQLLFGLAKDLNKTLVLVTHERRLAEYADINLHLSKGTFRMDQP
jgi:lipoprotein-releasing system ATP-binding protein